jgi:hypothetical protein
VFTIAHTDTMQSEVFLTCEIDAETCQKLSDLKDSQPTVDITHLQLTEAMKVALKNPVDYVADRGKFLGIAWSSSELGQMADVFNHPLSLLNFTALIAFFVIIIKNRKILWPSLLAISLISLSVFIPLLVGHIEIRYLLPLKLQTIP